MQMVCGLYQAGFTLEQYSTTVCCIPHFTHAQMATCYWHERHTFKNWTQSVESQGLVSPSAVTGDLAGFFSLKNWRPF